ncbi:MAG: helix-turn-helix transcriptional regulator [Paracoccaceae bacterium]|nr:MAG: helix-turn-helix transcriptional regulator [Paracoccaceae bacterium]
MDTAEMSFAKQVEERLKALNSNAFAVERQHGLPADAIRSVLRGNKKSGTTLKNARAICDALGLDFYIGPRRSTDPPRTVVIDSSDYAVVPLHDAALSAGPGALNGDSTVVGALAFQSDWLRRQGIEPGTAALARVSGDSMRPTLVPGDVLLIDTSDAARQVPVRRPRPGKSRPPIYALADGSEALVKRLIRPDHGSVMLLSDNPDWPPDLRTGRALEALRILGRVVWSGRTWADKVDGS